MRRSCLSLMTVLLLMMFVSPLMAEKISSQSSIKLSNIEKQYLKENPKAIVAIGDVKPYAFLKDDTPTGFTVELLKKIAEKIPLELEFKQIKNLSDRLELIKNDKVQILTNIIYSKERKKSFLVRKKILARLVKRSF